MRPSATAIVSLVLASQNAVFAAKIDDDNQYDKKNRKHNFYSFLKCTINYRIKQGNPRLIAGNHPKIGLIDQSFTDTLYPAKLISLPYPFFAVNMEGIEVG